MTTYAESGLEIICTTTFEITKVADNKWIIEFDNAKWILHRFSSFAEKLNLPCFSTKDVTVFDGSSGSTVLHMYSPGRNMMTWGQKTTGCRNGSVTFEVSDRSKEEHKLTVKAWESKQKLDDEQGKTVIVKLSAQKSGGQKLSGQKLGDEQAKTGGQKLGDQQGKNTVLKQLAEERRARVKIHDQVLQGPVSASAISFGGGATVDIKNVTVRNGSLDASARGRTGAHVRASNIKVDGDYNGSAIAGDVPQSILDLNSPYQ